MTTSADWLLSFAETRRELRPNLDVWGLHIVRHAAAVAGAHAPLVHTALNELVERGVLNRVRYVPHMPDPVLAPGNTSIWHNTEHAGPSWKWVYRVAPDWRERAGLPPSTYWKRRRAGVVYSGEGSVPAYLQHAEVVL